MKKLAITQFVVLAFVSGLVTVLTFYSGGLAAGHWHELSDGKAGLPTAAIYATQYGYWAPLICCLFSVICIIMISIKRPSNVSLLWQLFTLIVVIELIALALITWFTMFPAIKITCRMM